MKIKFYLAPGPVSGESNYQHMAIALAEGLRALGYEFRANCNYWSDGFGWLFAAVGDDYEEDVSIYTTFYLRSDLDCAFERTHGRGLKILLDRDDGLFTDCFKRSASFDIILRAHFNTQLSYAENVRPWAFGLTNRMVESIDFSRTQEALRNETLLTYRVGHSVRKWAYERLRRPIAGKYSIVAWNSSGVATRGDDLMARQTGGRHDPEFYARLNHSRFTLAFGGVLALRPVLYSTLYEKLMRCIDKVHKQYSPLVVLPRCAIIYQQDSWRFWEVLYSNSIPITFDLLAQQWLLPEMPVNWQHYIGLSRRNPVEDIDRLLGMSYAELQQISQASTLWVRQNYSPTAQAQRFLSLILD